MLSRLLRCAAFFCARSAALGAGLRQSGRNSFALNGTLKPGPDTNQVHEDS